MQSYVYWYGSLPFSSYYAILDFLIYRLVPLSYGILLLGLALYKATEFWRDHGLRGSRLVYTLIMDQVSYFFLCVATYSRTGGWWWRLTIVLSAMLCATYSILYKAFAGDTVRTDVFTAPGSPTLLCVLGSHIFFNLFEACERGVNIGTNWSSYSHSAVQFEEPEEEDQ